MEFVQQCGKTGLQASLIRGLGSERDEAERDLLEAGVPLPLLHRAAWAASLSHWEPWFLLLRDAGGRACGGVAIEKVAMRAMPGHVLLRVRRFGGGLPDEICRGALEALASLAKNVPRVLRLQVNVLSRDRLEAIGKTLEELRFQQVRPPSSYTHTLIVDLKPTEDEIFKSFSTNARRRIRETMKHSVKSLVLTDPIYAERLAELQQAAFQRTRGDIGSEDWQGILKISSEFPNLSRIGGLFDGDDTSPEKMDAFLWICNHGDHWEYRAAGSARRTDVKIPFGYQLAWDMIRWAKASGADWFDMGGVTLAEDGESALEGISRFKRYFSRQVAEVGAEWILEPSPVRARIANAISSSAHRWLNLRKKQR